MCFFLIFDSMGTAELKSNIAQLIQKTTNTSLLEAVYALLSEADSSDTNWYENLSPKAKASIQRGIEDADNGRFVSHTEVKAKIDKLLGRNS
ncbi:hypothetical protein D3C87_441570 [compost metagenome]